MKSSIQQVAKKGFAACIVLLSCGIIATGAGERSRDSIQAEVTLRYNLEPGTHYAYRLVTDQVVVNDRTARLQTLFELRSLARDFAGNTRCRIKIKADTTGLESNKGRIQRTMAGRRLWSDGNAYDAVMDVFGKILSARVVPDGEPVLDEVDAVGNEQKIMDVSQIHGDESATQIPEILNFILPTSTTDPNGASVAHVWADTFTVVSRVQATPSIRPGQSVTWKKQMDTLYRTSTVDSVEMMDGRETAFMSMKTDRRNASGTHLVAYTKVQRDTRTGIVVALSEQCFRVVNGDERLHYTAQAFFLRETSTPLPMVQRSSSMRTD